MNKMNRLTRNLRVVLMRLRNVPAADVAKEMGISPRQVRRIMAEWRESSTGEEEQVAATTIEHQLRAINDELSATSELDAEMPPAKRAEVLSLRIARVGGHLEALKALGVSFEGAVQPSGRRLDLEVIEDVNSLIRRAMKDHSVPEEVIESVIDAAMEGFALHGFDFSWLDKVVSGHD